MSTTSGLRGLQESGARPWQDQKGCRAGAMRGQRLQLPLPAVTGEFHRVTSWGSPTVTPLLFQPHAHLPGRDWEEGTFLGPRWGGCSKLQTFSTFFPKVRCLQCTGS